MQYTLTRLCAPDSKLVCQGAATTLRDIGGFSKTYCKKVVEDVKSGFPRAVKFRDSIGEDNLKLLAIFFEISKQQSAPVQGVTQLKLWEVTYIIRGEVRDHIALVLAENKDAALKALVNKVTTFGGAAREVRGPFRDGQVLTTRVTFK